MVLPVPFIISIQAICDKVQSPGARPQLPTLHRYCLVHSFTPTFKRVPTSVDPKPCGMEPGIAHAFSALGWCPLPLQPHSWPVTQTFSLERTHGDPR